MGIPSRRLQNPEPSGAVRLEPAVRTGAAGASAVAAVPGDTANPPATGVASRAPGDTGATLAKVCGVLQEPPSTVTPVILAGGFGTRLQSAVQNLPKVLAPIRERPFLTYLLDQLARAGFEDVVLCTGHMGDRVRQDIGPCHDRLRIRYSQEQQPLGTAGAVRHALGMLATESILLMNGDSYTDVDLRAFLSWHSQGRFHASLVLTHVPDTQRYGTVVLNSACRVQRFAEKLAARGPGWVNAGIYLFPRAEISGIPAEQSVSLEKQILPALADKGQVHGFGCQGAFIDIGTPESYAAAEAFFAERKGC